MYVCMYDMYAQAITMYRNNVSYWLHDDDNNPSPSFLSEVCRNTGEEHGRIFYSGIYRSAGWPCGIRRHSAIAYSPISADRRGPVVAVEAKKGVRRTYILTYIDTINGCLYY